MTPAIILRAEAEDISMLASLRHDLAEEQRGESIEDDTFEERFAAWWAQESARRISWLALVDGMAVGMLNLAEFTRMPRPGARPSCWGYIANVFVLASHRSTGIGGRLVESAVGHARTAGYARLVLAPSEQSVPMYQRAGFGPADMLLAMTVNQPGA